MRIWNALTVHLVMGSLLAATMAVSGHADTAPFLEVRSGDPAGRTILLIPGLASSGEVWTETAQAFAATMSGR
jgi:pimeloyl-ACP methyl ester carboxylesterase